MFYDGNAEVFCEDVRGVSVEYGRVRMTVLQWEALHHRRPARLFKRTLVRCDYHNEGSIPIHQFFFDVNVTFFICIGRDFEGGGGAVRGVDPGVKGVGSSAGSCGERGEIRMDRLWW